jgi:hypothetical protein
LVAFESPAVGRSAEDVPDAGEVDRTAGAAGLDGSLDPAGAVCFVGSAGLVGLVALVGLVGPAGCTGLVVDGFEPAFVPLPEG